MEWKICPNCKRYKIRGNTKHVCVEPYTVKNPDSNRIINALERIADALEKIAAQKETA